MVTVLSSSGGDVEQAIARSDERHVRAYAMAEVNGPDDLLRGDINDHKLAAVGAGTADAGVAVNGGVGQATIARRDDFMRCESAFGDRGDEFARSRIDDAQRRFAFLSNQKPRLLGN